MHAASCKVLLCLIFVGVLALACGRTGEGTITTNKNGEAGTRTVSTEPVEVESFTATTIHKIELPGKANERGGTDFSGTSRFTSIAFTPGAIEFNGKPVDFHGKEDDFVASDYSGVVFTPSVDGAGKTTVRGVLTASGFAFPEPQVGNSTASGVQTGEKFSSRSLDLAKQELVVTANSTNWNSPVVPELNGATVTLRVDKSIVNVDPTAGTLEIKMNGKILAVSADQRK
jgi:hypothetical protein